MTKVEILENDMRKIKRDGIGQGGKKRLKGIK
jgi:hypothetical protein